MPGKVSREWGELVKEKERNIGMNMVADVYIPRRSPHAIDSGL